MRDENKVFVFFASGANSAWPLLSLLFLDLPPSESATRSRTSRGFFAAITRAGSHLVKKVAYSIIDQIALVLDPPGLTSQRGLGLFSVSLSTFSS